jgi:hypothetical protein
VSAGSSKAGAGTASLAQSRRAKCGKPTHSEAPREDRATALIEQRECELRWTGEDAGQDPQIKTQRP